MGAIEFMRRGVIPAAPASMTLVIFHAHSDSVTLGAMDPPPKPPSNSRGESPMVVAAVVVAAILFAWVVLWLFI